MYLTPSTATCKPETYARWLQIFDRDTPLLVQEFHPCRPRANGIYAECWSFAGASSLVIDYEENRIHLDEGLNFNRLVFDLTTGLCTRTRPKEVFPTRIVPYDTNIDPLSADAFWGNRPAYEPAYDVRAAIYIARGSDHSQKVTALRKAWPLSYTKDSEVVGGSLTYVFCEWDQQAALIEWTVENAAMYCYAEDLQS